MPKALVFEKNRSYADLFGTYEDFRRIVTSGSLDDSLMPDPEECTFDLKIHSLNAGECPARPIWHFDGTNYPTVYPFELFALYLEGDALSETAYFDEFDASKIPSEVQGSEKRIHRWANDLANNGGVTVKTLSFGSWLFYNSMTPHAATKARTSGTRILVRAREYQNRHREWKEVQT